MLGVGFQLHIHSLFFLRLFARDYVYDINVLSEAQFVCVSFFPHRVPGLSKGCCGFRVLDVSITNCGEQMLVQSMEEGLGPEKSQT